MSHPWDEIDRTYEYNDSVLMRRMLGYILAYPKLVLIVTILVVSSITFNIIAPFVLQHAIDVDFVSGDLNALMHTAALYVVLMILVWVTTYGQGYTTTLMGQRAVYAIRQGLFEHLQEMSQDYYDETSSGSIISRLTNDIDRMSELLSGGLINTFAQFFIVFAVAVVVFMVDIQLAIITLTVVPVLAIATYYFRKRAREAYRETRKTISKVTANFAETIAGAKVTKTFTRERESMTQFEEVNWQDYLANVKAAKFASVFFPAIRFVGGLGVVLILLVGGIRISAGTLTVGTLLFYIQMNALFFRPVIILTNFYNTVQSAFAGAERVFAIMDREPSIRNRPDAIELQNVVGHIRYRDVTFAYIESKNVLEHFNLEIQPGETVALVGDTGAGKTTVVNLLNRFYEIQSGAIEIDGIDIRDVTLKSLRANIGLVLQDSFLFSGTIKDNIRYGRPDATDEEIINATKAIGADELFRNLERGYDTEVGERGSRLSEGERQLVSFARALLADPRILILDEATSSIDIYTEHTIQKGMRMLLEGRTAIVIAHRLSTIVNADRILVLEHGKIVESGTHNELMARRAKYYSLYEKQIRPRTMIF